MGKHGELTRSASPLGSRVQKAQSQKIGLPQGSWLKQQSLTKCAKTLNFSEKICLKQGVKEPIFIR